MSHNTPQANDPHEGKLYGVHSAEVVDTDDPENEGRVKVTLNNRDDLEERWARIVTSMAGDGFGMHFQPDEGTEVLVTFENGDVEAEPFVVGSLHNKDESPPEEVRSKMVKTESLLDDTDPRPWMTKLPENEAVEVSIHTIKTQTGSKIVFKEVESAIDKQLKDVPFLKGSDVMNNSAIVIKTQGGKKVVMDDLAEKLHVEDGLGNEMTMDEDGITLKSEPQWNIPVPDVPLLGTLLNFPPIPSLPRPIPPLQTGGTINIEADNIQISGTNIDINGVDTTVSGHNMTVKGLNTTVSGLRTNVTSTAMTSVSSNVATTVSSNAYTSVSSRLTLGLSSGLGMTAKAGGAMGLSAGGGTTIDAGGGVSMTSGGGTTIDAGGGVSVTSGLGTTIDSGGALSLTSGGMLTADSGGMLSLSSGGMLSAEAAGMMSLDTLGMLSLTSASMLQATAPMIMLN